MLLKIVIVYEKGLKFILPCGNIYIDYYASARVCAVSRRNDPTKTRLARTLL